MACNFSMNDEQLIKSLGGPTKLARMLGYEGTAGSRRVHNWIKRGIPPRVKLENMAIFGIK